MEFIHKKKAEKARTKQLADQVKPIVPIPLRYDDNFLSLETL